MTLLSFSGTTSRGPFWQQILQGRKVQTCRSTRKRPIRQGDRLHLYWMVRIPASKKPIHKIGEAVCTSVRMLQYSDFAFDDAFAVRDGFRDHRELQHWFGSPLVFGHELYDVISWGDLECGLETTSITICPTCARIVDCHRVSEALLLAWESEQESGLVGKSAITEADVLEVVRRHRGSTIAVRTVVNALFPSQGRHQGRERGVIADAVSQVLEHELGPPLSEIHGNTRATVYRQNNRLTSISKVFPRATVNEWLVRSKKTGVVCHASADRKRARHWSQKFLGEHGEVVPK